MRKTIVATAALILAVSSLPPLAAASPRETVRRTIPGVVLVVRTMPGEWPAAVRATGTGFVIHKSGYVLTAFHNLGSTANGYVNSTLYAYFVDADKPYDAPPRRAWRLKVVKTNYKLDLALLRIDAMEERGRLVAVPSGRKFPALELADSDKVEPTDAVHALGFPLVARTSGSIFSGITVTAGQIVGLDREARWIKSGASISPGNSGGPSIDREGRVIGINTMVRLENQTQGRIALVRPINLARHLAKGTPAWDCFPVGIELAADDDEREPDDSEREP